MRVNIKYNVKRVFALILHFFGYTLEGISLEIRRVFIQPHLYYNFFRLEYLNVIWREPYDDEDDTEVGRNERWRWWRGERLNQKYTQADSWTFITVSKTFFYKHTTRNVLSRMHELGCACVLFSSGETRYEDFEVFLVPNGIIWSERSSA